MNENNPQEMNYNCGRFIRDYSLTQATSSGGVIVIVNVELFLALVLSLRGFGRRVIGTVAGLAGKLSGSVDVLLLLLLEVDFSRNGSSTFIDLVVGFFFIRGDNLLSRKVEAIVITMNLVEGLVEGAVEDGFLLGSHGGEAFQVESIDLNYHKGTDTDHVVVGDGFFGGDGAKVCSSRTGNRTEGGSLAKGGVGPGPKDGEKEKKRSQALRIHYGDRFSYFDSLMVRRTSK